MGAGAPDTDDDPPRRFGLAIAVARLTFLGVVTGVAVTAVAGAWPGSQGLNPLSWVTSVATVAALVTALNIYRVQRQEEGDDHQELLDRLSAQDELLTEFASAVKPEQDDGGAAAGPDAAEVLTPEQRAEVEAAHGRDSIAEAWELGSRGGDRPRLVRLKDGKLLSVYRDRRGGGTRVRAVDPGRLRRSFGDR